MAQAQTSSDLDAWAVELREKHPEMFDPDHDEPMKARNTWSPAFLRVYGLRPWEMGGFTLGEYNAMAEHLQEHGL